MPTRQAAPSRLVVRAPNWLGDAIMALPALADIRRHFAASTLAVAARGSVAPLFRLVGGVDEVVTLSDGRAPGSWLRDDPRTLAGGRFDAAVLLPNSFSTAWTVHRAGIRERWGYATDLRARLLTRAVRRPRRPRGAVHHSEYYQDLVRGLDIPSGGAPLRVSAPAEAAARVEALLDGGGRDARRALVAVAPGAAYGRAKQWPPEYFAEVVRRLHAEGAQCVIVGGRDDAGAARAIESSLARTGGVPDGPRTIDLTGHTDLEALVAVLSACRGAVSNDSGAMHVAAAVGVPVAAIFGPSDERETAPLGRHAIVANPVWCRPCLHRECPIDHRCMRGLTPERVATALASLVHFP